MSNLAKRLLTAAVAVPILLLFAFVLPTEAFMLLVCAAAAAASHEYFGIVARESRRLRIIGPVCSVAAVALLSLFAEDYRAWLTVGAALPLISLLAFLIRPGDLGNASRHASALALGLLYTAILPCFVALIHRAPEHGGELVLLLLTHLLIFAPLRGGWKKGLMIAVFAFAIMSEGGGWLVRFVSPSLAVVKIVGFVGLQASLAFLLASLAVSVARPRRAAATNGIPLGVRPSSGEGPGPSGWRPPFARPSVADD